MSSFIYQTLAQFGYLHPLHPIAAHLPIGLISAGFLFALIARLKKHMPFYQTAQHCMVLALVLLLPTIALGFMDWHHFYGGAPIFPIRMKLTLALILCVLLSVAVYWGIKARGEIHTLFAYGLCLIVIAGLGYFGGELVFGRSSGAETGNIQKEPDPIVSQGRMTFNQQCSACHYSDRRNFKAGPGLKDLFLQETLYKSNWPVTEANVRKQITDPFGSMPDYSHLPEETLDALIAYLKTL